MHIDNLCIVSERFPMLRLRLEKYTNLDSTMLRIETSRIGEDTLCVMKDNSSVYLHSKYDPITEAQTLIGEYRAEIEEADTHVVFYGTGLGYQIEAFCKLYPRVPFSIFEPIPELMLCYLTHKELSDLSLESLQDLVLGDNEEATRAFLQGMIGNTTQKSLLIVLPSHARAFPQEHNLWTMLFKRLAKNRISRLKEAVEFEERRNERLSTLKFNTVPLQENKPQLVNLNELLSKQFKNDSFNRMDVIVRYLAIEQYYGKNDCGYRLYEKMQLCRGQKTHNLSRFKELIRSIETKGFLGDSPIELDENWQLIDGSHRVAAALFFGEEYVPVKRRPVQSDIHYSMKWFETVGFSDEERRIICDVQENVFFEKGVYFTAVIWGPAAEFFEEITSLFHVRYPVARVTDYAFGDFNEYASMVRKLYESDDIESWKIEKKLEHMRDSTPIMRVIWFVLDKPDFRPKALNGKPISRTVETIKREIRGSYHKRIRDYFFDIILHIGDNYEHSRTMWESLREYSDISSDIPQVASVLVNTLGSADKFKLQQRLELVLSSSGLANDDVLIVGSSSLELLGIRQSNDIDIVVHPDKRSRLTTESGPKIIVEGVEVVAQGWGSSIGISDHDLVTDSRYSFRLNGFRFVRPELIYLVKRKRRRDKDIRDVISLDLYSQCISNWDVNLVKGNMPSYSYDPVLHADFEIGITDAVFGPSSNIRALMVRRVEEAVLSIGLMMFGFDDAALAKALVAAKQRGINVSVLVDKKSMVEVAELGHVSVVEFLRRHGVDASVFANHQEYELMHHKVLILDGKEVLVGSSNWLSSDLETNLEYVVGIHSRKLADIFGMELYSYCLNDHVDGWKPRWINIEGYAQTEETSSERVKSWGRLSRIVISKGHDLTAFMLKEMAKADKKIRIMHSFFGTEAIIQELIRLSRLGVGVQVLTSKIMLDNGEKILDVLRANGVEVKVVPRINGGIFHHKAVLIDNTRSLIGSLNLYHHSLTIHHENCLEIDSVEINRLFSKEFDRIWSSI